MFVFYLVYIMKSFSPVAGKSANRISAMSLKWIMTWRLVKLISISFMISLVLAARWHIEEGCLEISDYLCSSMLLHACFKSIQKKHSFQKIRLFICLTLQNSTEIKCCMEHFLWFTCSFWSSISLSSLYPLLFSLILLS